MTKFDENLQQRALRTDLQPVKEEFKHYVKSIRYENAMKDILK
jgi:hypothetical protein